MADITLNDLTDGTVGGTGAFDVLMTTVLAHLQEEYDKSRIRGSDYSKLYLGALTAVMQQAQEFVLSKQTAAKQAEVAEQQVEKLKEEIKILQEQLLINRAQISDNINSDPRLQTGTFTGVLGSQKDKVDADAVLADEQKYINRAQIMDNPNGTITNLTETEGLLGEQKTKLKEEIVISRAQVVENLSTDLVTNTPTTLGGLLGSQKSKVDAETDVTEETVYINRAQVADSLQTDLSTASDVKGRVGAEIALTEQQVISQIAQVSNDLAQNKPTAITGVIGSQKAKIDAETDLLGQKKTTEAAQTDSTSAHADSVIGKQKALYKAQTDGFARDAEQKATKIAMDAWNVLSTISDVAVLPDELRVPTDAGDTTAKDGINKSLDKLLDGIGVNTQT